MNSHLQAEILASYAAIASFDRRRREYRRVGWIYACSNSSFVDSVYKVGQSARPPSLRVSELGSSTSVYRDFQLVYFVHVSNRDRAEGQAHTALDEHRVNRGKEFFQAPLPVIVKAMDVAANAFPVQRGKTPRAGVLEQPLQPRQVRCPRCESRNRVPTVLTKIRVKCGSCAEQLEIPSDLPGWES